LYQSLDLTTANQEAHHAKINRAPTALRNKPQRLMIQYDYEIPPNGRKLNLCNDM